VNVKVKLSLITHWRHMGILEVQDHKFCHGTRSMWVDSIMLWLLYSWRKLPWFPFNKGSRAILDHLEKGKLSYPFWELSYVHGCPALAE